MKIRCGLSIRNGGRIFAPTPKLPKSFFSLSVSASFFSRSTSTSQLMVVAQAHQYLCVPSCLPDRKTETRGSKVLAGIKQESPAAMIEDARVLDHVGVPPIGRHIDAFISSEPSPGKSFFGYSMLNAILRTSAAEPHSVAVGIFHDAWLADRILVGRGGIDNDPIKLLPVHRVGRFCIFDDVYHILLVGPPAQI